MSRRAAFGVVGAYGATGRVVVSELLKSSDGELLIGGRDEVKLHSLATESGRRAAVVRVDVLDMRSLDAFCSRCSVVVNCAGPVVLLQNRVAEAAFRGHCHYVDPAGMSVVKERMLAHGSEIAGLGLSFVVSAGWTPGITELLPFHAYARAKAEMDSIESIDVYFSDSGEWSDNALRDGVSYIRGFGLARPGYFRKGEWVCAKTSEASRKIDLGDPIGRRRFSLFSMPELKALSRHFTDCSFRTYSYLAGFRNAMAATLIAALPLPAGIGIRLLRSIFHRNRLAVAGFVVVNVNGNSQGRSVALRSRIVFDAGRDYWMNGVALATTARMVAQRKTIGAGVQFLCDAVDPMAFMQELRKAGVQQTETWLP